MLKTFRRLWRCYKTYNKNRVRGFFQQHQRNIMGKIGSFCVEFIENEKVKVTWPSMVTHTQNLCSAFNPSKCTHTHTVNTHTHTRGSRQSMLRLRGAVGGSVSCSRVSPQSWYWRWRECWLFTPPTYNSCRTWDSNPRPSCYKSDSLSLGHDYPLGECREYSLQNFLWNFNLNMKIVHLAK